MAKYRAPYETRRIKLLIEHDKYVIFGLFDMDFDFNIFLWDVR